MASNLVVPDAVWEEFMASLDADIEAWSEALLKEFESASEESVEKFNDCHDDQGKFCETGDGGSSTSAAANLNVMPDLFRAAKLKLRGKTSEGEEIYASNAAAKTPNYTNRFLVKPDASWKHEFGMGEKRVIGSGKGAVELKRHLNQFEHRRGRD